jgi:hypothetical protein
MSTSNKKERDKKNQVLVDAALVASDWFKQEDVAHCLVGRLGMASHGFDAGDMPDEVVFLVDASEAFSQGPSSMVLTKVALPLSVGKTRVKWSSLDEDWEVKLWSKELSLPEKDGDLPVAPLPLIICGMMMEGDEAALSVALKDGASAVAALGILTKHAPRLASRLSAMMEAVEAGGA